MITTLRRFKRYLRPFWRPLGLGSTLTVVDVAVGLAQPWPLQHIVDRVLRADAVPANASLQLGLAVGAMVALALAGAFVGYWSNRLLSAAGLHIAGALRLDVLDHLQRLELGYHARHRVGDLSSRVTSDVDRTQDMFVQVLSTLFPNLLLITGMFGVMVVLDPTFTLLAIVASLPLAIATRRSRAQLRAAARRSRKADGQLAAAATENLSAIHLVQAFNLQTDRMARFDRLTRTSLANGLDAVRLQARFGPLVDISSVAASALVIWFGAHRVLSGAMSLGVLLVFVSYLSSLFKPVKALTKLANTVTKGNAAAERIASVLDTAPVIADRPDARTVILKGAIEFDQVTFSYGREPVLAGLSFSVGSGETVALVGPTGAGKSTVAALIPRLMDATGGAVRLDGLDVREHRLAALRAQVAMVLQESVLLEGTLRDNIMCGRPGASSRDVERAATLALVDEFAARLPDGLDTRIGERGANLSGGQRQRVAIARAILRDCPVIVLDEPTSALDAASEEMLVQALENLPQGRTTIVIAHRLSTVRRADRVLVLDRGVLVEQGTHTELLANDGLYRRLTNFQSGAADGARPSLVRVADLAPPFAPPLAPPALSGRGRTQTHPSRPSGGRPS